MKNSTTGIFSPSILKLLDWSIDDVKEYQQKILTFNKKDFKYKGGTTFRIAPIYKKILFSFPRIYTLIKGGRGGGKTKAILVKLFNMSFENQYTNKVFLILREIANTNDDSVRSELIKMINISPYKDYFHIPKNGAVINLVTGVQFIFAGGKDNKGESTSIQSRFNSLAKLKGKTGLAAIFLEEASAFSDELLVMLFNTARADTVFLEPEHIQDGKILDGMTEDEIKIVYKKRMEKQAELNQDANNIKIFAAMNPLLERDPIIRFLDNVPEEDKYVVHINIDDLPSEYQSKWLISQMINQRGRKDWLHVWKGQPKSLGGGKLIMRDWIKKVDPEFKKLDIKWDELVISIDPAGSDKKNSDETGIIVIGRLGEQYYVLEDASDKYSSREWSRKAIKLYKYYDADLIILETNICGQPGIQILEDAAKEENIFVEIQGTHALKSKKKRVEAISPLYEDGHVFHWEEFERLEEQLDGFTTKEYIGQDKSPDRADALVWGLQVLHYNKNELEATYEGCY